MTNGTITKPASAKQLKWLRDLLNTHDYNAFPADWKLVCDTMKERFAKLEAEGYEPGAIQVELELADKPPITHEDFQKLLPKLQAAPIALPLDTPEAYAKAAQVHGVAAVVKSAVERAGSIPEPSPIATTDGMFKHGDTFYKLRFAKTGRLWAHRLVFLLSAEEIKAKQEAAKAAGTEDKTRYAKFKFAGGPQILGIREDMKLTHEDAKAFGALYGMCCNCGRLLTNEVSIHLGIGPVCGGRQFGGDFKFMIKEAELAVAPKGGEQK